MVQSGSAASAPISGAALGTPVKFDAIRKTYGAAVAVARVDLDIAAGEFLTLLGPSGSGKTTTLMMLAGFERPTSGDILVGGRPVTGLRPAQRNIGMVFQSYALFPHMTVYDNIAFPLRMRGRSAADKQRAVRRVLEVVGLGSLGDRYPRQLSGGQQQRVALARAIIFEPPVLLMDEPLSALDKYLRSHLQGEIKRIQRELGITVLYVTHDQDEAMTMSDRICVMHEGRVRQVGTPETLYQRPADEFVAGFLGESNMIDATVLAATEVGAELDVGGGRLALPIRVSAETRSLKVSVRPEHIRLAPADAGAIAASSPATVADVVYVGDHRRYTVRLADGTAVSVKEQAGVGDARFAAGDAVRLRWPLETIRAFADGTVVP